MQLVIGWVGTLDGDELGNEEGDEDGADVGVAVGVVVGVAVGVAVVGAVVGEKEAPPPHASNSCLMCIADSIALCTASIEPVRQ